MDLFLFEQINSLAGKFVWLDNLAVFFAQYLAYILVVLALLLFWKKRRAMLQTLMAVILARFGIVELIRLFWQRPRPFIENQADLLIGKVDSASFPSGHAAFFFALSFVVYRHNKKAGILFFIASFLISISRIFVGVHWPLDILAGALVGVFSGWLVLRIFKR